MGWIESGRARLFSPAVALDRHGEHGPTNCPASSPSSAANDATSSGSLETRCCTRKRCAPAVDAARSGRTAR